MSDRVDRYVAMKMDEYGIPGMAVAVVRDGEVVKLEGYGQSSVELGLSSTRTPCFSCFQ